MLFRSIIFIIGAIAGYVSLSILIYKTWRERPRLHFIVENSRWYVHIPEDPIFTSISITLRIDNKGEHSTTIHRTNISFQQKGKTYNLKEDQIIIVYPNGTLRQHFTFNPKRQEVDIEDDMRDVKFIVEYTHGTKEIEIPVIKRQK